MSLPPLAPKDYGFPDPNEARLDADGLLAVGGDLQPARLLAAYANGIFPWFNSDSDQILWWCPNPRGVLVPDEFQPRRSLRKTLRQERFTYSADKAFAGVIRACAHTPRPQQAGTWITKNMQQAYIALHELGFAHSIEVWRDGALVGGLYGVALGRMFFGESMFSHEADASKCAFALLCQQLSTWNYSLLDCQMMNPHLATLGVRELPREQFLRALANNDLSQTAQGLWRMTPGLPALNTPTFQAPELSDKGYPAKRQPAQGSTHHG